MAGNPHPVCRFPPGQSGNPSGKPKGALDRTTVLRALPRVRTLAEVRADEAGWKGSFRQLLESVARDQHTPLDIRLQVASKLMADESPQQEKLINLAALSEPERKELVRLLSLAMSPTAPPVIDHQPVLSGWSASGAPVMGPPPTPEQERDILLTKLAKHLPAEEIERLRNNWSKQ